MNEKQIIEKYSELIERFLDGEATAEEFSTNYMDTFIEEEADFSEGTYQILQQLFRESDAFCADPELRGERDIDSSDLREVAIDTARKLNRQAKQVDS